MKTTQELHELGQSLWLDNITRDLLTSGTLERYINELSVTGLTSNPTIFDHAIKNSTSYDGAIRQKLKEGKSGEKLFFELALDDLTRAAGLFRPIHDRTNGVDGWVSLEVSPLLAHDTAATLAAARDLHARAGRPNVLIKIPGTQEGLPAIEEAIFAGVPVNVTLLFAREHYVAAAEAYRRGIERRIADGLRPDVGSVASVFVSRWDAAVMGKAPEELRDRLGIAVGQHRHQGPEGIGRPLRQVPGGPVHGEHHARRHPEGAGGPRRRRPDPAGTRRRLRGGAGPVCRGRHRCPGPGRPTPGRGGQVVRQVLAGTAGGHRVQERGHQESRLTPS